MISARELFDKYCARASKKLGQNFLFDENINRKIISVAGDLSEKIVLEVGPGPGGLTLEILKCNPKKLYVVEYDAHWAKIWNELATEFEGKLQVIQMDALNLNLREISPQIIISNLPYNISTQLLQRWLVNFDVCDQYVLMFQKEVAERICAKPNTKAYGRLSVLCQLKSDVKKIFDLEPGSFFPPPKVKSSVVKFIPFREGQLLSEKQYAKLEKFLSAAFAQRRKVILKCMRDFFENPEVILAELGYNCDVRPEQISVNDYKKLAEKYF